MDLVADTVRKDPVNSFVQLLWERGNLFEKEVISKLKIPFLDLSIYGGVEKERLTLAAMERGESLIYGGRINAGGLLGDPDLLRREGVGYVPGDIKSGAGEEGGDENGKLKKHYGVQIALYVDILESLNFSAGRRGFIWDVHGDEVLYDLSAALGPKTPESMWEIYRNCLNEAKSIVDKANKTLPAYGAVCKLCHWYTACLDELTIANDLTLLPELGRAKRNALATQVSTIAELAKLDIDLCRKGKRTVFEGIGAETLIKLKERAVLITSPSPSPYLKERVTFPASEIEIFFDIEVDPMRDVCYLHGFVERHKGNNSTENYIAFFADEPTAAFEEHAFSQALAYLRKNPTASIYYYSKYERTIWRKLQQKYPHICTEDEIGKIFENAFDLYYDVVRKYSEWPTKDYSIKTLAKYLGFVWRDTHPSGAASIEWFDQWIKSRDPAIKQRILEYNEDDCRATRVLLDGILRLPVKI